MSTTMFHLKVAPRRMLSQQEAADYCGLPSKKFPALCAVPRIAIANGVFAYDVQDLDKWIDQIKAGSIESDDDIIRKLG